jgi:hypothetical protein
VRSAQHASDEVLERLHIAVHEGVIEIMTVDAAAVGADR